MARGLCGVGGVARPAAWFPRGVYPLAPSPQCCRARTARGLRRASPSLWPMFFYATINLVLIALFMQLSVLFPFPVGWCVPRSDGSFVVFFEPAAPAGFVQWCQSPGVRVLGCQGVRPWRQFGEGVAVGLLVPQPVAAELRRLRSGGGGSLHPVNTLKF